ncbi:S-adenosyl-L-methionine-dependent methyltransferase [Chytriomyces sp. MP71]|nr:S-adenosyl-L-methionine-dependent methyltransferase [Chytriomyces sp. MP71]
MVLIGNSFARTTDYWKKRTGHTDVLVQLLIVLGDIDPVRNVGGKQRHDSVERKILEENEEREEGEMIWNLFGRIGLGWNLNVDRSLDHQTPICHMGQQLSKRAPVSFRGSGSFSFVSSLSAGLEAVDNGLRISSVSSGQLSLKEDAMNWHPMSEATDREYNCVEGSHYFLPNDDEEKDRLFTQHYFLGQLWGTHVICEPVRELLSRPGSKVLDVGCADGVWMDAVFARYPKAEYHGVDIAESMDEGHTLSSAKYEFGNVLEGLPYLDSTFDYVHQRMIFTGVPKAKWVAVIDELVRVAKPGAWIELVELDMKTYNAGPIDKMFADAVSAVMEKRGLDSIAGSNLMSYVSQFNAISNDSGIQLTNVTTKVVSSPKGWNGQVGDAVIKDYEQFLISLRPFLPHVLGISLERYDELVSENSRECAECKSFGNFTCVYAQVFKDSSL